MQNFLQSLNFWLRLMLLLYVMPSSLLTLLQPPASWWHAMPPKEATFMRFEFWGYRKIIKMKLIKEETSTNHFNNLCAPNWFIESTFQKEFFYMKAYLKLQAPKSLESVLTMRGFKYLSQVYQYSSTTGFLTKLSL